MGKRAERMAVTESSVLKQILLGKNLIQFQGNVKVPSPWGEGAREGE